MVSVERQEHCIPEIGLMLNTKPCPPGTGPIDTGYNRSPVTSETGYYRDKALKIDPSTPSSSPPPTETTDKDIPVVSTPVQSLPDTGLPVIALTTAVCPLIDNRL